MIPKELLAEYLAYLCVLKTFGILVFRSLHLFPVLLLINKEMRAGSAQFWMLWSVFFILSPESLLWDVTMRNCQSLNRGIRQLQRNDEVCRTLSVRSANIELCVFAVYQTATVHRSIRPPLTALCRFWESLKFMGRCVFPSHGLKVSMETCGVKTLIL